MEKSNFQNVKYRYMTLKVNLLELGKTTWPFSLKVPNPLEF